MKEAERLLCEYKHEQIDKALDQIRLTLAEHKKGQRDFQLSLSMQAVINDQFTKQMDHCVRRMNVLEQKPQRRAEQLFSAVLQWITLAVLGVAAAKIGL
ncbi:MAG: hypothetical protein IJP30_04000 [Clostridia bacterium]|nr:hypothetical protein [Clostridia bacterium]